MPLLLAADIPPVSFGHTAEILIAAIPVAGLTVLGILGFFQMFWDHQRRLAVLKSGGTPPSSRPLEKLHLVGLVLVFVGSALILFFWAVRGLSEALLTGIIPAAAGLAILVHHHLVSQKSD